MTKCLFLLALCLLPFVALSSTFSSHNPIELPTATVSPKFLDLHKAKSTTTLSDDPVVHTILYNPVTPDGTYRMGNTDGGVLGGYIYLGKAPNSDSPCPDAPFKYNGEGGTSHSAIRLIPYKNIGKPPSIHENQDFNIQFTEYNSGCSNYTTWKVEEQHGATIKGASLVSTKGGTIGQADSSWFRLKSYSSEYATGYLLLWCPGPILCPTCTSDDCYSAWMVLVEGRRMQIAGVLTTDVTADYYPLVVGFENP
ncbi:hypothetical protein BC332_03972 [Capsicum chinense]|nr:hypothetical protein BC332_03972 [Capsicum chinense]